MSSEQDQGAQGAGDLPEIEVIIEEAAPGAVEGAAGAEAAPGAASGTGAEPDYAALKRDLEAERAGRAEDRRRAETATREAAGAQATAIESRLGQTVSAIGEWSAHTAKLKADFVKAQEVGDFAKAADLTEAIGKAGGVMQQLENNKAHFEALKKNPPQPQRQTAPSQPADPVEAFAAGRPAKTQAWVRANPDFIRDPKKFQRLQGAHQIALADHAEGSDGYFEAVNATLGIKAAAGGERRTVPVAAPPSRDAGSLSRPAGRPTSVRLSAVEVEMAKAQGMTPQEWARLKVANGTTTH